MSGFILMPLRKDFALKLIYIDTSIVQVNLTSILDDCSWYLPSLRIDVVITFNDDWFDIV